MHLAARRQSGRVAPVAELLAEGVAAVWLASRGDQERQVFARRHIEDRAQMRMHRDCERRVRFLLLHVQRAVLDVLPSHADHIAAPLAGIEQQREREAWLRADRMMRLELRDLFLGPRMEAVALDRALLDVA